MGAFIVANIQAVFIDRDGTIGGTGHFMHPKDFTPYNFSVEALQLLKKSNLPIYACTNQYRISRGEATIDDFRREFAHMEFDDAFICPHRSTAGCDCHKPAPGLFLQAARKYQIDLTKTVVIGDVGSTDMIAAHKIGAKKVLVKTGWGKSSLTDYLHTWQDVQPDYVADHVLDAAHWVLKNKYE